VNYYNEHDPKAAAWLRELIKCGHIPDGIVDERSIEDVVPSELTGFTQCHFFAGIGGWSLALKLAGWPEDRPVWTGSCPCQPFSSAGKGGGFADERHLWPAFHHLINQCQPSVVFGEQVASKDGLAWLDLVRADCEASGYAFGASDLCAAGIGAPHIRQRLWWVAYSNDKGLEGRGGVLERTVECVAGKVGVADGMANADSHDSSGRGVQGPGESSGAGSGTACKRFEGLCSDGRMANPAGIGREVALQHAGGLGSQTGKRKADVAGSDGASGGPGPLHGFWRDADWLHCRDGKWRPVEPGTFPLAHGIPARVVRLRGYGNAIVPQVAATFIEATGLIQ